MQKGQEYAADSNDAAITAKPVTPLMRFIVGYGSEKQQTVSQKRRQKPVFVPSLHEDSSH